MMFTKFAAGLSSLSAPPIHIICDAIGIAAVASVAYGAWLIYPPAGFIVLGALVLAGVIAVARSDDTGMAK